MPNVWRCEKHKTTDPNEIRARTSELCFDCLSERKEEIEAQGYPRPRTELRSLNRRLWELGAPRRHAREDSIGAEGIVGFPLPAEKGFVMKATFLAVLALVLVLASSTEAARRLITSKDIKNGTIRVVDLHPHAKAELSLSVRTVRGTAPVAPGEFGQATASCPQGERPLGGGFGFVGDTIQSSATTSGWWVSGYNDLSVSLTLNAYAYCAPHVTALQPIP